MAKELSLLDTSILIAFSMTLSLAGGRAGATVVVEATTLGECHCHSTCSGCRWMF